MTDTTKSKPVKPRAKPSLTLKVRVKSLQTVFTSLGQFNTGDIIEQLPRAEYIKANYEEIK